MGLPSADATQCFCCLRQASEWAEAERLFSTHAHAMRCRVYIPAIYAVNKIDQITLVGTVTPMPSQADAAPLLTPRGCTCWLELRC